MGDLRGNITARRLQERQEYAAARERQREINAAAEAGGAGGITVTDQRTSGQVLMGASRKAGAGAPENKAMAGPGENKNALSGVDFASDAAAEAAIRAGLTAASFKGTLPSGTSGYTKADVLKVIG